MATSTATASTTTTTTRKRAPAGGKAAAKPKRADTKATDAPSTTLETSVGASSGTRFRISGDDAAKTLARLDELFADAAAHGRIQVASAAHSDGVTILHVVRAGDPGPFDAKPGAIMTIGRNGLLSFDALAIGLATADLLDDAGAAALDAFAPDGSEATATGRHPDWKARALAALDEVSTRHFD